MRQAEAVLDFGTSKIVCLLGNCEDEGAFEVYGIGNCEYKGIKKGRFLDESSLPFVVKKAIDIAQSEAARKIREVYVGVPGSFCEIICSQTILDLGDKPRQITEADIDELIEQSFKELVNVDNGILTYIQSMPMHYKCDGNARKDMPIGTVATTLWGAVAHIFSYKTFTERVENFLEDLGISVSGYAYSTFAEGTILIPETNANEDAIILDVGYYESDICIMRNSVPVYKKTLPVGGVHFASDISYILQISQEVAETIKRRYVFGLDYSGKSDTYRTISGKMDVFDLEQIQDIIEARLVEFAALVNDAIDNAPININQDTNIYVCGGGISMMRGSKEFFQAQTEHTVRYEAPWLPRMNSACYYSSFGVLNYVFQSGMKSDISSNLKNSTFVKSLINFFTK